MFSGIPPCDSDEPRRCGVRAVDLGTAAVAGFAEFLDAVQEVSAVEARPGLRWPDLVTEDRDLIAGSFALSDAAPRDVPPASRAES